MWASASRALLGASAEHCCPSHPGGPWACCLVADARVGWQVLLGEGSTVALDGQRVLPERAQEAGFEFEFSTIGAALRDAVK